MARNQFSRFSPWISRVYQRISPHPRRSQMVQCSKFEHIRNGVPPVPNSFQIRMKQTTIVLVLWLFVAFWSENYWGQAGHYGIVATEGLQSWKIIPLRKHFSSGCQKGCTLVHLKEEKFSTLWLVWTQYFQYFWGQYFQTSKCLDKTSHKTFERLVSNDNRNINMNIPRMVWFGTMSKDGEKIEEGGTKFSHLESSHFFSQIIVFPKHRFCWWWS